MMAKSNSTRPLTSGGRSLGLKSRGSSGPKGKRASVWFASGNNKGEDKGKSRSVPGKSEES